MPTAGEAFHAIAARRRRIFPRHRCPPQAKLSPPSLPTAGEAFHAITARRRRIFRGHSHRRRSCPRRYCPPQANDRMQKIEHHLPSFGDTSRCLASVTLIGPGQVLLLLPTRSMYSHQCLPERHPCQSLVAGTRYARGASGSIGGNVARGVRTVRELGRASSVTSIHVPLHPVKVRHGFSRFLFLPRSSTLPAGKTRKTCTVALGWGMA